jgi:hypothetical protein
MTPARRPQTATTYTIQLQRNRRLVEQVGPTDSLNFAVKGYRRLLRMCRGDGMAVIIRDGVEISPRELRDEDLGAR